MEVDTSEMQAHKINMSEARERLTKVRRKLDNMGDQLADELLEIENILDNGFICIWCQKFISYPSLVGR